MSRTHDQTSQAFPIHICILQVIRTGNYEGLGMRLQESRAQSLLQPSHWTMHHYTLYSPDVAAGVSPFILRTMRVAHHVSRAVSFNFTGNLPAGYAPLTIDEVFYLATLGGARGKNSCN